MIATAIIEPTSNQ